MFLRTGVHSLGGAAEVKCEAEAVGKHRQRAARLLIPSDARNIAEPLGMQLRPTAANIYANLQSSKGCSAWSSQISEIKQKLCISFTRNRDACNRVK